MPQEHLAASRPANATHAPADCSAPCRTGTCRSHTTPEHGILIARDGDGYRLLHGQLRLAASLSRNTGICVEVRGEGLVRILRAGEGLLVERGDYRLPLFRNA